MSFVKFCQFFHIPCANVYGLLDGCNVKIAYLERQLENLIESAMIFGLSAPARADLDSCRIEIKLIKVQLELFEFMSSLKSVQWCFFVSIGSNCGTLCM